MYLYIAYSSILTGVVAFSSCGFIQYPFLSFAFSYKPAFWLLRTLMIWIIHSSDPRYVPKVMFFTPELLSKRDSGFGLLWYVFRNTYWIGSQLIPFYRLAATLGSRSTFKKLPKRSVLTADITQLCDLISEPEEPLALRLSSNLMFGVVR